MFWSKTTEKCHRKDSKIQFSYYEICTCAVEVFMFFQIWMFWFSFWRCISYLLIVMWWNSIVLDVFILENDIHLMVEINWFNFTDEAIILPGPSRRNVSSYHFQVFLSHLSTVWPIFWVPVISGTRIKCKNTICIET